MVTLAGVAPVVLVAALTAGGSADSTLSSAPERAMTHDGTATPLFGRVMEACDSGGLGSDSCNVTCHIAFNFYTSQCNVSCRSGYYACCSCDAGCHCIIDHDEMWPLPPPPDSVR